MEDPEGSEEAPVGHFFANSWVVVRVVLVVICIAICRYSVAAAVTAAVTFYNAVQRKVKRLLIQIRVNGRAGQVLRD